MGLVEHDVKEGLDLLSDVLYRRRNDAPAYKQLHDLLSIRRLSRGRHQPIEPTHQLLLGEIIYDLVSKTGRRCDLDRRIFRRRWRITSDKSNIGFQGSCEKRRHEIAQFPEFVTPVHGSTTAFFAERFASAFPGTRAVSWHDEADDIKQRLLTLLRETAVFQWQSHLVVARWESPDRELSRNLDGNVPHERRRTENRTDRCGPRLKLSPQLCLCAGRTNGTNGALQSAICRSRRCRRANGLRL